MVEVGDQVELYRPTVVTLRAVTVIVCMCVCVRSVATSCLSLWDHMDCNLPGSSVHGISQARILEWVAISFSRDHPRSGIKSSLLHWQVDSFFFLLYFIYFFKFYFIFKLYIIVLVLPNIKMNPPQVYMCSPS